ncbi:hypothetical protein GCM10022251_49100 [Phytohabitans flavus]|uniref:Uncharacterized protein n=1 Tax=Phytohabitans flavus TaxID=1076124 RepID=A0A6F8XSK3_9ACTN|nr:hypothetical protein [Phytohabitans flavus]BCB76832.1 hypothetical protein Pflav_032420 [Phytohabitans flavus]
MGRLRTRLVAGVAAAVLATGLVVPAKARPAQAAVDPATVAAIIQFAASAYAYFNSSQNGGLTLEQATSQIIGAVNASRDAINAHADALAVAEATGCVRHHVLELADIEEFPLDLKQLWAQDVTRCVTLIDALWNAVTNATAKNQIGILLGAIGPIALIARAQARFSVTELKSLLVNAFTRVQTQWQPYCMGTPYGVNEEFWMNYHDPIWLDGGFFCFGPYDTVTRTYVGQASAGGLGLFQHGMLIQYDFSPLIDAASKQYAHGVAVASLAQLRP